ncbi:MAG: hypothetical protein H0W86_09680 [Armatimonadetes bacterium]|nr:hypothetical protein [Armatimonadota bacterium]
MKKLNRTLHIVAFVGALTATSQAWDIVTQPVETRWYKHRARDLEWNCKSNWQNNSGVGFRPTSIDILYDQDTYSYYGYTYVVSPCVRNTGAHYKDWQFMYDESAADISDWAYSNGYTITDLEEYKEDGDIKYAALMEKHIPWKPYFIYAQATTNSLIDYLFGDGYGGKIVDMDVEEMGNSSLHGAINWNVPQTGVNWDTTMTWAQVQAIKNAGQKRLLDLQRYDGVTYCALWCDLKPGESNKWSYFGNVTSAWISGQEAYGWRVQTTNSQMVSGQRKYSGVLVWND